jgi:spore germination protein KC
VHQTHQRNSVRYYLLLVALLIVFFFVGDFGTLDTQKTAIVMAVGIDRRDDTFIVTSQIAVPESSKQGKSTQTVQLVSRGKTVADAFADINAKTGWYPKLVFCNLIVLGENTAKENVFDALEFFMLDEYMSDGCLVATCDGLAKDLLNVSALIDPSGSIAIQKILSAHAKQVGTALPVTLREFSIGYFGESSSGYLPLVTTKPQQDDLPQATPTAESGQDSSSSESGAPQDKPVFSAGETALFVHGKRVGVWTQEETFAFNAVTNNLRLASYNVGVGEEYCTLSIKNNSPKNKLVVGKDGRASYQIDVTLSAGLLDYSKAPLQNEGADSGDVPHGVFSVAEKRLSSQIERAFEKCKTTGCDAFGILDLLQKYHPSKTQLLPTLLQRSSAVVSVHFRGVR